MPNQLQRPQRHNPLRPYVDSNGSNETFPGSTVNDTTSTGSPPFSSTSSSNNSSDAALPGRGRRRSEAGGLEKHDRIYLGSNGGGGGTGMQGLKEPKEVVRKRVTIMTVCGLVVAAIITIAILGVKKIL